MIEILDASLPATLQDAGRPGYRHLGVPLSGALDPGWLALANALAGNPPATAAIEIRLIGPRLRATKALSVALAGEFSASIEDAAGNRRSAGNWRSLTLAANDILDCGSLKSGIGYLAVQGGFALPAVLGSRSTYARAGLGGIDGRGIRAGDRLPVMQGDAHPDGAGRTAISLRLPQPPGVADAPLRVIAGPQREYFSDAAWSAFITGEFTVSRAADRMGLRLDGPGLEHTRGADIISDAVTPGAIQVPGDGRPIILLADCQTVGGYPKIATVIGADLPRLGHALPGQTLRFTEVGIDQALAARREAAAALAALIASIVPDTPAPNLDALYNANLIDGVIHAQH
jgi:biotin-dependent carboxylase-like uncharacterized protein